MDDSYTIDFARSRSSSITSTTAPARSRTPSPAQRSWKHTLGLSTKSHPHSSTSPAMPPEPSSPLPSFFQERFLSRLLQSVVPPGSPTVDSPGGGGGGGSYTNRRPFSLTVMSNNFRRFNARIGIVFLFEHRLDKLLTWRRPVQTLSLLSTYTFLVLNPQLLPTVPFVAAICFILVPAFTTRHLPDRDGPPIAPPRELRAASEISMDFFRNLRDLQNVMDDFSTVHDAVIGAVGPPTNFHDETLSTGVFLLLLGCATTLFVFSAIIPWREVLLVGGWVGIAMGHPKVQRVVFAAHDTHLVEPEKAAEKAAGGFMERDIALNLVPETREVEIFELQRKRGEEGEYEAWVFSPNPWEPLAPQRIAEERPQGCRFFEDVQAPKGWEWGEEKWTLDLGSLLWVQERYVNGVEVEEEGERWVYDNESGNKNGRGLWRRRRWVRVVKRRYVEEK